MTVGPAKRLTPLPMFVVTSEGPLRGRVLVVDEPELVIGRRDDVDLHLDDPHVSRTHAVIRKVRGTYTLEDLGSTGGTFVNGEAVTGSAVLRHGDTVRFGVLDLRFEDRTAMGADDAETALLELPAVLDKPVLSPRQQEVLGYLYEGLTNPEIALHLGVTERTVKAHCQEVYDRLGARNRTAAVAAAMRMGLLDDI